MLNKAFQIIRLDVSYVATYIFKSIRSFLKKKMFKYNRKSERSGCDLKLHGHFDKLTTCHWILLKGMLKHTERQLELFETHCFAMFITALCVIFLITILIITRVHYFSL